MTHQSIAGIFAVLMLVCSFGGFANAADPVVVVELFTSQGCSSCPPADRVLSRIEANAAEQALPVHVLSFHVDYWNRLGWRDPYSSKAFSQRQNQYAAAANSHRVYTPQMIVNGSQEFVGSHSTKATSAIRRGLQIDAEHTIDVDVRREGESLRIGYEVDGPIDGRVINVALVNSPPANKVDRGENRGATLRHTNVVRSFVVEPLTASSGVVTLPTAAMSRQDSDAETWEIIAYVQDPATARITGAASQRSESWSNRSEARIAAD